MLKRLLILFTILIVAAALVPAVSAQSACYGGLSPRLQISGQGQVTPGLPNTLRSQPYVGYDSVILGQIPAGGLFSVLGGPNCFGGLNWWQVNYNGQVGWTPEGSQYGVYWLQPVSSNGGCMPMPSRLIAGQYGRVLPTLPNMLRSQPYIGYDSLIVGQVPVGALVQVIAGPNCSNSMTWWLVSYNGVNGWTAEGQAGSYWLEPSGAVVTPVPVCASAQLRAGYTGFITPGIPNNLRSDPSLNASVLASIASGESFVVLSGPVCNDGQTWWQVSYRGVLGWTVEGRNGNLWVAPLVCGGFQPSRISVGRYARVTYGLPNRLRSAASTTSPALALIPAGARIDVIGGPVCSENSAWWRVNYGGRIGWTMEGQGGQYWLEPAN